MDWKSLAPSGWHVTYWFNQPELEARLMGLAQALDTVTVLRGTTVTQLSQDASGAELAITGTASGAATGRVAAQYVVGADGANSFVRTTVGREVLDKGYFFDWLILDMKPSAGYKMSPAQWQLCDPLRPTTIVPGGPGRRRWEFMVLPTEDRDEIEPPDRAWQLLEPWGLTIGPEGSG